MNQESKSTQGNLTDAAGVGATPEHAVPVATGAQETPAHDLSATLDIDMSDWDTAVAEWRGASAEVESAIGAVQWPNPTVQSVDAWLAAVNRQSIAHTRCAALCELQLQKNRRID